MNGLDSPERAAIAARRQDEIVVVSGGSGGIGRAVAARLATEGAQVCISYLSQQKAAREFAARLVSGGARVIAVRADVGREEDVVSLFQTVDRELGRVTALVNNAGVIGGEWRIDEVDAGRLAALWATNITGYFLCAREAVRRMSTRHGGAGGAIVNVSSMAGARGGSERRVAYGASKGAINAFTMGLGKELAQEGIRVNAVLPGYVDTEFHDAYGGREKLERAAQAVPMKRAGRPEEVAEAVVWLLSAQASFVTASLLNVSGGA
jgi:NAD(P)-dependent dehydrogenase (short-subunit alcohol dehydrogenase family)